MDGKTRGSLALSGELKIEVLENMCLCMAIFVSDWEK